MVTLAPGFDKNAQAGLNPDTNGPVRVSGLTLAACREKT